MAGRVVLLVQPDCEAGTKIVPVDAACRRFVGHAFLAWPAEHSTAATYARLAALKQKYDPTNLFRLNQNIKPAG